MTLRIVILCSLAALPGCTKSSPSLAGGKSVDYWVEAAQSSSAAERKKAVFELGNVGDTHSAVVPALRNALKDKDSTVRCEAILALMKCGPKAKEDLPLLDEMRQHDENPQVRSYAAKAIEKLKAK